MEIEGLDAPSAQEPRWMNDTDLNEQLQLLKIKKLDGNEMEATFQTPIGQLIRRTMKKDKSEYAYLYNNAHSGKTKFVYQKKGGFRQVVGAF